MNAIPSNFIRRTGLLAGAVLILSGIHASAADQPIQADAFPVLDSYIKVSGQTASITGNKAAFRERMQQPENGSGGIEELHYNKDFAKDSNVLIDGRALFGAEDYLGRVRLSKTDVGSFEFGYKSFRTFYDGIGGFFPLNKQWMPLANQELYTDRSRFWIEGTINLPKLPVITLKYSNEVRDGKKDSTIWGDTDLTGLPFALAPNPVSAVRKISPSYLQLDERHKMLEASVKQTVGNTTYELVLLRDETDNLDTRYVTRFPGEVIPWAVAKLSTTNNSTTGQSPQNIAKAALAPVNWNNQILQQQSDGIAAQTNAITGKVDTVLNEKLTFHLGGSYQLVNSDVTGERPLVTSTPTSTGVVPVNTATFTGLTGSSNIKVYTGNFSVDYKPVNDLFVKLAVRGEEEYIKGSSQYTVLSASGNPAITVASTPRVDFANITQRSLTPAVDLRYTGIKNVALYFTGSKRVLNGDEKNTSAYNPLTAAIGTRAINNLSEDHGNYTLGANWRACSAVSLRAEIFDKHHQFSSVGYGVQLGDYYLVDSKFQGAKLTAIVKPLAELTSTTRYVYQKGKYEVTGFLPTYPAFDSGDAENHNISETIDWVPNKAVYFQLNANVVFNTLSTIYPRAGTTPATATVSAFDSNAVLHNSNNNYVTGSFLSGFVASKNTDVQIQYTYYKADNGDASLAALTQPFGAAAQESIVTVGFKHKLSERAVINGKIGYADSKNDTTGGNTNFHGPLGYVSLTYAL